MNYWWVVANDRDPEHGWHWNRFFSEPLVGGKKYPWGGADWIKSHASQSRIEQMRKGDLVLAYQASQGVVGFVYLATNGFSSELNGRYDSFNLEPSSFVVLNNPIPLSTIRELPSAGEHFEFVNFHQGTVFRSTSEGFAMLLHPVLDENKRQKKEIQRFLSKDFSALRISTADALIASSVIEPPKRIRAVITRVVRDTPKTRRLKRKYQNRCQLCNYRIEVGVKRFYVEVHHIRPLGGRHSGLDEESNMMVLCPNHHACFDLGVPRFVSRREVMIGKELFLLRLKHEIGHDNIAYHNDEIFGANL